MIRRRTRNEASSTSSSLDNDFTMFCVAKGHVTTVQLLLEFLNTHRRSTGLTYDVTPAHVDLCADVWSADYGGGGGDSSPYSNGSPTTGGPLTKLQCHEMINALKAVEGVPLLEQFDAEDIFFALSNGEELLPVEVAEAIVRLFTHRYPLDLFQGLRFLTVESFFAACRRSGPTAVGLLQHIDVVVEGAARAHGEEPEPHSAGHSVTDEGLFELAVSASSVAAAIKEGNQRHMLAQAALEAATRSKQTARNGKGSAKAVGSFFAPLPVVESDALGRVLGGAVAPFRVALPNPQAVVTAVDTAFTPQALSDRVRELRRYQARQANQSKRQEELDIQHAVYEAMELANEDEELGSRRTLLRPMSICGKGEAASNRLFPHQFNASSSIQEKLRRCLGVEVEVALSLGPPPPPPTVPRRADRRSLKERRNLPARAVTAAAVVPSGLGLGQPTSSTDKNKMMSRTKQLTTTVCTAKADTSFASKYVTPSLFLSRRSRPQSAQGRPATASPSSYHPANHHNIAAPEDLHHQLLRILSDANDSVNRTMVPS